MSKAEQPIQIPDVDKIPREFSNAIAERQLKFDWANWRQSIEWKMFVSGYNAAVKEINAKVSARYNLGETAHRVFGDDK